MMGIWMASSMTSLRDRCLMRALNMARQSVAWQEGLVYMHIFGSIFSD